MDKHCRLASSPNVKLIVRVPHQTLRMVMGRIQIICIQHEGLCAVFGTCFVQDRVDEDAAVELLGWQLLQPAGMCSLSCERRAESQSMIY